MDNATHLYALIREGYDDPYHTEYYLDELLAKNKMISFAIRTRRTACIYVYELHPSSLQNKLKIVGLYDLATEDNGRLYKIWLKQETLLRSEQHLSTTYILAHPEIMYDCLTYIEYDM